MKNHGEFKYIETNGGDVAIVRYMGRATKVTIPAALDGTPVTEIDEDAFEDCEEVVVNVSAPLKIGKFLIKPNSSRSDTNISAKPSTPQVAKNQETDISNFEYTIIGNSVRIDKYKGIETSVIIPANINNVPVTMIGKNAFLCCESLKSISIPNSVTEIGDFAFCYCFSLESINIPNSVTEIGESAFCYCESLKSINIPNSVTKISKNTFLCCESLKSINIPNFVTEIGQSSFSDCKSLVEANIPNSVTEIGQGAFLDCELLKSINIPNSVTEINEYAFWGCSSLKKIKIPEHTKIANNAFGYCPAEIIRY